MRPKQPFEIPYTIGFCTHEDKVLMLHRKFPPNQHLWNGVGGHIDAGETPDTAMAREMMEETHLDAKQAQSVNYVGIVKWNAVGDEGNSYKGMYAYIIKFENVMAWKTKMSDEGLLEWKKLDWVMDKKNPQVVENIPHFLPLMLETSAPLIYDCEYVNGIFEKLSVYPLT